MPYLSPHELSRSPERRNRAAPLPDPSLVRAAVALAPVSPGDAARGRAFKDWFGHVEAGRVGAAPTSLPAPPAGTDYGLASLAAILGPRRVPIW